MSGGTEMDMAHVDGGTFLMGSNGFYPEEQPVHQVTVAAFELARYAVTNAQFATFAADTGYLTVAEQPLDPAAFGGASLAGTAPGSLVFTPTRGPVSLADWRQWWTWVPGTSWRHPYGPGSTIEGKEDHPVVQVAYPDAQAFARWCSMRLPSEAEWEYAARGGLDGATYTWGERPNDGGYANTWQGHFPYRNTGARGHVYTAPVGSFPPNSFGLYEMTGNTWEWTSSVWTANHALHATSQAGDGETRSCCPADAPDQQRGRVLKGGSHLCSPQYCLRYRPAARSPQTEDSATTHIGFRCARSI